MAGVLGEVVHEMVKLGPDEVQGAGVAQGPPLSVDDHVTRTIII